MAFHEREGVLDASSEGIAGVRGSAVVRGDQSLRGTLIQLPWRSRSAWLVGVEGQKWREEVKRAKFLSENRHPLTPP